MEAKIVDREATNVIGLMARFSDEEEHIGELWGEFMTYSAQLQPLRVDDHHYGVAFLTDQEGVWDYLASVAVVSDAEVPEGLVLREIPAGAYVLVEGTLAAMDEAFDFVYKTWLPVSDYERDLAKPVLDVYPPGTTSGDSVVLLYVPLEAKGAEMVVKVCREEDRVWLEGVTGWFVGDRESSVHAAQAAVMEAVGEEIGYFELLGTSGLAFRMQVSKDGLCPSSPHSFCGYQCVAGSVNALPWHIKVHEAKADDAEAVKAARQAVVESIERGVPVQYGNEEDGIIVGYQKGGEEWICFHPMREGGTKTFVETTWPWGVAIFTGPKEGVPSKRELALSALKQAVEMNGAGEADGYFLGPKAWDDYLAKLRALQEADEQVQKDSMLGNSWIYECLVQYRFAAMHYLRGMAGEFAPDVAGHLLKAAELYEKMTGEVLTDSEHCVITIAPMPWALKEGESWTNAMRAEQIRRLEAALPLEREAMEEIKVALNYLLADG